jgi:Icc-related predicted phosphoesterase
MKLKKVPLLILLFSVVLSGCSSSTVSYTTPVYNTLLSSLYKSDSSNSFILIGDTQRTGWVESTFLFRESNDSVQFELFRAISNLEKEPAFIVHLGDMVFDGADNEDWIYFDNSTLPVRSKSIPIVPVLGNHEYFGDEKNSMLNISNRFTDLKDSTWRSFKFKNVGFILLNSNTELSEEVYERQKQWYKKEIDRLDQDNEIKHIIVVTHQPPFTNGTGIGFGDDEFVKENFVDSFNKSKKAKMFISGHCHNYEHLLIDNKHYIISGGGGGPRRSIDLEGNYKDITIGKDKDKSVRDFHFVEVKVEQDSLKLIVHTYDKETKTWGRGDEFSLPN